MSIWEAMGLSPSSLHCQGTALLSSHAVYHRYGRRVIWPRAGHSYAYDHQPTLPLFWHEHSAAQRLTFNFLCTCVQGVTALNLHMRLDHTFSMQSSVLWQQASQTQVVDHILDLLDLILDAIAAATDAVVLEIELETFSNQPTLSKGRYPHNLEACKHILGELAYK